MDAGLALIAASAWKKQLCRIAPAAVDRDQPPRRCSSTEAAFRGRGVGYFSGPLRGRVSRCARSIYAGDRAGRRQDPGARGAVTEVARLTPWGNAGDAARVYFTARGIEGPDQRPAGDASAPPTRQRPRSGCFFHARDP
jgi:hypothetical protein